MQRILKIFGFYDRENRPKDFFLGDACMGVYIGDNRWLDKVARSMMASTSHKSALALADLDILSGLLQRVLVNDRTNIYLWIAYVTYGELFRLLNDLLQY